MNLILGALCLIVCKKVPTDIGVNKIDQLHNKVKIVAPVPQPQTRPHGAVLRLKPATRTLTAIEQEEIAAEEDQYYKHYDEIDQDNKSIAMNGRSKELNFTVTVINQYAGRMVREEVVAAMAKAMPEFFKDEHGQGRRILDKAEKLSIEREEKYIESVCSEYDLPLFDLPTDVNTFE